MNTLQVYNLERKAKVMRRLVADVIEYHGVFNQAIPMSALSQRFSKSLEALGGFYEALDELLADGSIRIQLKKSGGKIVFPASSTKH